MSSQRGVVAPLKFSAGGSKHSTKKSSAMIVTTPPPPPPPQSQASRPNLSPPPTIKSNALTVLSTGLTLKRSPLHLENWIACLLTLDGRDKFTKVLQYSCRLLSWYFGGLVASSLPAGAATGAGGGILTHLFQDTHHRSILYQTLSHRFHLLYQSLVESRKAFRLGRSFIEYDKLRSMGWGEYLMGVVRGSPLLEGTGGRQGMELELKRRRRQFHAQSIPEHHDEDASSSTSSDRVGGGEDHGQESWNEDEESDEEEEKKAESASEAQPVKVIARQGRPHLPSRVSSNIGWGPSTALAKYKDDSSQASPSTTTAASRTSTPKHTLSELGNMYRSTRSSSMGWVQTTKTNNASKAPDVVPPAWKLIGTTFKLIGLMGFWTFDNLAFLTGSGFLDPLGGNGAGTTTTKTTTTTTGSVDAKSLRIQRKKRAAEWGARFYFMGALAGFYVNVRGIAELWNGALRKARTEVARAVVSSTTNTTKAKEATASSSENAVLQAKQQLKAAETKLFELYLALLKSICDCIVFSNNPGVDLHLKLRGRKNHEGLHCCCGLISAGTVLFGNFPNA